MLPSQLSHCHRDRWILVHPWGLGIKGSHMNVGLAGHADRTWHPSPGRYWGIVWKVSEESKRSQAPSRGGQSASCVGAPCWPLSPDKVWAVWSSLPVGSETVTQTHAFLNSWGCCNTGPFLQQLRINHNLSQEPGCLGRAGRSFQGPETAVCSGRNRMAVRLPRRSSSVKSSVFTSLYKRLWT